MKYFTKQNTSLCSLHGKRNSNQQNYLHIKREKLTNSKKPSATKHSHPTNVYSFENYRILRIEYRLIVKPYFTRRNEK